MAAAACMPSIDGLLGLVGSAGVPTAFPRSVRSVLHKRWKSVCLHRLHRLQRALGKNGDEAYPMPSIPRTAYEATGMPSECKDMLLLSPKPWTSSFLTRATAKKPAASIYSPTCMRCSPTRIVTQRSIYSRRWLCYALTSFKHDSAMSMRLLRPNPGASIAWRRCWHSLKGATILYTHVSRPCNPYILLAL